MHLSVVFLRSSRVRIEVLRAIALKITRPENTAYCVSNVPRPYLSVGPPRGGRRSSYKYVEAVETFGECLTHADLTRAYERAGNRFIGKLIFLLVCCLHCDFPSLLLGSLAKTFLVLCESQSAVVMGRRQGDANNNPPVGPVATPVRTSAGPSSGSSVRPRVQTDSSTKRPSSTSTAATSSKVPRR